MEFIAFYDKVNNNSPLSEYDADRFLSTLPDEGEKNSVEKVTRVEVIDHKGRSYTNMNVKNVILSFQDDSRTLKIFCNHD